MGVHSRSIPANGSSISAWIPSISAMRRPDACRAAYRSSAVFPMPGFAADHQYGAPTVACLSEHGVETFTLARPADETNPPQWLASRDSKARKAAAGPSANRLCRRHLSRNREHLFGRRPADADAALAQLASDPGRHTVSRERC